MYLTPKLKRIITICELPYTLIWGDTFSETNPQMGFQYRFALILFTFTLLFLASISLLFYYQSKNTAIESAGLAMEQSAQDIADYIDVYLEEEAHLAAAVASADIIETALLQSNAEYGALTTEQRQVMMDELEQRWKANQQPDAEIIQRFLYNPLAQYLRRQQQQQTEEYGEIFLTNRYGVVVGTTNKLTTITHAHKYWWQEAFNQDAGRIYFDDRGYDNSVNGYVVGIVYPIMKDDRVIGILKINLSLLGTLNRFLNKIGQHGTRHALLTRSGGRVILEAGHEPLSTDIPPKVQQQFRGNFSGHVIFFKQDREYLAAYAPVALTFDSKHYGFGGRPQAADHSQGNQDESWYVTTTDDMENILAPAFRTTTWILETGLVFAILIAILAVILGRAISHPIIELTNQVQRIGKGDLDAEINIDSADELSTLASTFNTMVQNLKKITVSRDQMEEEVKQRRIAESKLRKLSLTDELTGLFNRRGLLEQGERQLKLSQRTNNQLFMLFADVDCLKHVNDIMGHEVGDALLCQFADILKATLRESDIIARIGGDEFAALIIEHAGAKDIAPLMERMTENIRAFNNKGEHPFRLSVSIGISKCDHTIPCTMEELITNADQEMYKNKQQKKGSILKFPQPPDSVSSN